VLFQIRLDAMVLNTLLLDHFVHHSHWNTAVAIARTAVAAVNVD